MNGQITNHPLHRVWPEAIAGGSVTEGIGALSAVVLAILGLAGVFTNIVASVATIVVGAVLLADSMLAKSAVHTINAQGATSGLSAGMGAGFFGGIAGIVLGILSFFHPMPEKLISVAVLVFGAALFMGSGTLASLTRPHHTLAGPSSGTPFMGLAVTVLGILAVIGLAPMTLALAGLLGLGATALFGSSTVETGHELTQ
ncbi:MAG TPA: hypothetical protein VGY98_16810 [Verrucomicrobiae bacterium]|nr:hypothetical protein [Verrucomicrobiae bacterium]